ncbi:MAG: glycerophosphodiester phosphodiesterase family protein [Sulfuricaulis sp.]|nr:glycerophosphodiester phosphodiesterase family protein [Sulfuricaulis sp.]
MIIPKLVAHRGYPRHYPENTLIGIEAAVVAGARFVEVDVQISRDRVPVLFHDRGLKRLCGVDGRILDYRYDELWAFRVSEPGKFGDRFNDVHITRLAELGHFLQQHPDVTAFIELKRSSLEHFGVEAMLELVHRALEPALAQCALISYSLPALLTARHTGWSRIGAVIDQWSEREQPLISEIHPQFLFCDADGLPRAGDLHADDMKLVVFEVAQPPVALALAARGVDFIETFAVGEMIQGLASLSAAAP